MVRRSVDDARIPETVPPAPPDADVDFETLEQLESLGYGGSADVVKMRIPETDTVIAVKQPRTRGTLSTDTVSEFLTEAETWAKLDDHDGIVSVVDWGADPVPWIALEYMDGGTVADRAGAIPVTEALWIGIRVADAVHYAHRHGVAHLDLKPSNVLFRSTPPDCWDVPKVSDWGLARVLLEHTGSVEGISPQHAAPEQFDADEYGTPDDRTDIYQLGALLHEMLTGEPPFSGGAVEVMNDVLTADPPAVSSLRSGLPASVDGTVKTALAKDPADRYETAVEFRKDLESAFEAATGDGAVDAGHRAGGEAAPRSGSSRPEPQGKSDPAAGSTGDDETGIESPGKASGSSPGEAGGSSQTGDPDGSGPGGAPADGNDQEADADSTGITATLRRRGLINAFLGGIVAFVPAVAPFLALDLFATPAGPSSLLPVAALVLPFVMPAIGGALSGALQRNGAVQGGVVGALSGLVFAVGMYAPVSSEIVDAGRAGRLHDPDPIVILVLLVWVYIAVVGGVAGGWLSTRGEDDAGSGAGDSGGDDGPDWVSDSLLGVSEPSRRSLAKAVGGVVVVGATGVGVMQTLSGAATPSPPNATFDWEYDASNGALTVTHEGGDVFDSENTDTLAVGAEDGFGGENWSLPVGPGDTLTLRDGEFRTGRTVRVIWVSPDEEDTARIASYTVP